MEFQPFYRLFRRALRACQLYPPVSPVREEAAAALWNEASRLLASRPEGLSLAFLEDGVYVEHEPVDPGETDGPEPAPLRSLFHAGVRELRFLPAIEQTEILRLIAPLARAQQGRLDPIDEDLGILLWEADLRHVGYLLYESPFDDPSAAEESEAPSAASCPSVEEFIDEPGPGFELAPLSGWGLAEDERLHLLAVHRREEERDVPVKFARLLLEILRLEIPLDERNALEQVWKERVSALLVEGRFDLVARISQAIHAGGIETAGPGSLIGSLSDWLRTPETAALLVSVPPAGPEDGDALGKLVANLSPSVWPDLVVAVTNTPVPAAAVEVVRRRVTDDLAVQSRCLRDGRDAVVALALEIIRPTGDDVRFVRDLLQQAAPSTRVLAVRALGRGEGPGVLSALIDALADPAEPVRIEAALALGRRPVEEGLETLLRTIASSGFALRSAEERRAVYVAAGRLAPREVWPLLAAVAERRTGWWRRRPAGDTQVAVAAIAQLGPAVLPLARERWRRRPDLMAALESWPAEGRIGGGQASEEPGEARAA